MILDTKHFGEMETDASKFITFKDGIPGFEELRQFLLIAEEDGEDNFFYWLQSVEQAQTAFLLIDMIRYMPEYDPKVEASQVESLESINPEDFVIYNIAVLPEDAKQLSVNLRAPIVINPQTRLGKQVVCLNDEYDVKHYLFA